MPTLTASQFAAMRDCVEGTQLAMRCDLERLGASSGVDAYNQPVKAWASLATAVPCFWWEDREQEIEGPNANVLISSQWLLLPRDTDIGTTDRVAAVRDMDGSALAGRLLIREVHIRANDVLCRVEAQVTD